MSLIESGAIIAIEDNHPPYAHQKVLMIKVEDYIYEVPYVIDGEKIFFKTIYSSRQSTDKYLPE